MKVLVISDIHLKPYIIDLAIGVMEKGKFDQAVFLGDFCDDWNKGKNIGLYEDTFDSLGEFIRLYPDTLICYGNHDLSYIWGEWETGYSPFAQDTVNLKISELQNKYGTDRWKIVHKIDNIIFSHAGITNDFVKKLTYKSNHLLNTEDIIDISNDMIKDILWEDNSPIWARPNYYSYYVFPDIIQVVGHTPVTNIKQDDVILTDVFSTYNNGDNIGNCKYLVIDSITKEWKEV